MLEPKYRSDHDSGKIAIVHRACPLCGHDNAAGPANRYSHAIWEVKDCARCGFVYIEKAPDLYSGAEFTAQPGALLRVARLGFRLPDGTEQPAEIHVSRGLPSSFRALLTDLATALF